MLTDVQAKFEIASRITGEEFLSELDYFANAWLPARDIVKDALEKRLNVDESGAIVVFNQVSRKALYTTSTNADITC